MRAIVLMVAWAAIGVTGCSEDGGPPCRSGSSKYYAEALAKRLTKNGVPHSIHSERGICYAAKSEQDFEKAAREVDNYFYEVAGLFRDNCEERAFTEWAKKEKLPFQVHDTTNSDGKPGGRLFHIYSITEEDVSRNKKILAESAPRDARCKTEAMK